MDEVVIEVLIAFLEFSRRNNKILHSAPHGINKHFNGAVEFLSRYLKAEIAIIDPIDPLHLTFGDLIWRFLVCTVLLLNFEKRAVLFAKVDEVHEI